MMLTVKQAAQEMCVSATCVYQLVSAGKLACHRIGIGRGTVRISNDDLAAYIDSCRLEKRNSGTKVTRRQSGTKHFKHLTFEHNRKQGSDDV